MSAPKSQSEGTANLSNRPSHEMANTDQRVLDFARASGDWFWEIDADGRFTFVSEQISDLLGVMPEDCLGKTRPELQGTGTTNDDSWQSYDKFLDERQPFRDFRYWHRRPDGQTSPIAISGVPVFDGNRYLGFRGTGRKVSRSEAYDGLLRTIITETSQVVGTAFLKLFAGSLNREIDIDVIVIGELSEDGKRIQTLAVVEHGEAVDNFAYELQGTPATT